MRLAVALLLLLAVFGSASAHEVRPAYLELREEQPGIFSVLWKTPMLGDLRLAISPVLSGQNEIVARPVVRRTGTAFIQIWNIRAIEPLRGQSITIDGLERTMTDALLRVEFADGSTWVKRLTAADPQAYIPQRPDVWTVARDFFVLGVEHILSGLDHLGFVLALLLLVRGWATLIKTVTAFTIAHSITLALSTLDIVRIAAPPVEAAIALSIVFVATEIAHLHRGRASLTSRAPWIVAFLFGLLHGFGFAGALRETGLPEGSIVSALLFFNLGVEAGQLLFIAGVGLATAVVRTNVRSVPRWAGAAPAYLIGSVAMFWFFERLAAF